MIKHLIPDKIASRTLLAMILGLALSHGISVALYVSDRNSALTFSGGEHIGERIATIDRIIRSAPPPQRQRLIEVADEARLHITLTPQSGIEDQPVGDRPRNGLQDVLRTHLSTQGKKDVRLRYTTMPVADLIHADPGAQTEDPAMVEAMLISMPLPDKTWLNFAARIETPEPLWSLRFVLSMAVMLLAVTILSALVVHHLTNPLAVFAAAAQRLGVDVRAPPLKENGPAEVRQAARAFNDMQNRIRRFVEDRTQMIAAISHDLGTPITRMRLRSEFVEDPEQREKMLADLDDMEKMVFSVLSFARDEAAQEPQKSVDLRTLLQRVSDDAGDAGHMVAFEAGNDAVPYNCRPVAMRRAIGNLIDNAAAYGQRARLSLDGDEKYLAITIDDDGPGINPDHREEVFKPFHRLEGSRNRETGGTGLGMTVARTIIRAHGGDVTLENRPEGGLRVKVLLPL